MNAGELCVRDVVVCRTDLSVIEAARLMRDHHVGSLVVYEDEDGPVRPVGVVTDRDLAIEVLASGGDPGDLRVVDVMTAELVTATEDEDVDAVLRRMRAFGVRRVPIVDDDGVLQGILTYDDLLGWMTEQLGDLLRVVKTEVGVEEKRF